uniref:Phytochrome B n=1 Tax=Rhizophora mucronata TaxID=61149 RepID=A0A2P2PDY6_RHIMU
MCEGAYWV